MLDQHQTTMRDEATRLDGAAVLEQAIRTLFTGRLAIVSSFGAESAVLLSLVADIDRSVPILFVETRQHFPETLTYRRTLTAALGLTDVRDVAASDAELREADPAAELWQYDPDACCKLRKVTPLDRALRPFEAWVTGRKRHQATTRGALPFVECSGGKVKINPMADWDADRIEAEMVRRNLPRHPLSLSGYPSIGCAVCTRSVAAGEDPRSGRWAGTGKVECGIHLPAAA